MYCIVVYLTYFAQLIANNLSVSMKIPIENRGYVIVVGLNNNKLLENHDLL
jgi:hypothetical protein